MTIRELAFLALRVLSIYLFILGLSHLTSLLDFTIPTYLQVIEHDTTYAEVFLIIGIPTFVLLVGGVILWIFAEKLSSYMVPKSSTGSGNFPTKELEGFVLSVIGLILLILSFTSIVRLSMSYIHLINQEIGFDRKTYIYPLVEQAIRLLIGIILLFKAEGLALMLRKTRNLGLKHLSKEK
ncbi:hypothetical protein [Cohnella sp. WQ 127256]|uniref:hypothetical protein n=1 Tax=Cohnella sp. WQ 127256 TaxID=2938790 RepID=UPI002117FCE3|nr:hypothetical protein [Cohnella sp. WQ 127256]